MGDLFSNVGKYIPGAIGKAGNGGSIGDILGDIAAGIKDDFLGRSPSYEGPGLFAKDTNHAKSFNPDYNPVRQKFNGYVNFHFNGDIDIPGITDMNTSGAQTTLSSMIKTAELPSADIQTDVKNQYNKKRITVTHAEFKPISISAYDTVDSAWVTVLMRMYSHLFSNPMGQFDLDSQGQYQARKVPYDVVPNAIPTGDGSGPTYGFNSGYSDNNMGYNLRPGKEKYFVSHIDIVMFHAQRTIVYTLFNPIVTNFTVDGIDHQSAEPVMINMDISYENFSIKPVINGFIPEADMERFTKNSNNKESYKRIRANGALDLGDEPAGSTSGNDTRNQASLKENQLGFLAPNRAGEDPTNRLMTDQKTSDFWKAVAQPATTGTPTDTPPEPDTPEDNKTYTCNGKACSKEEYDALRATMGGGI
jgi:hypothetical protein|tara:strand:- start:497 stop:1750 length:1254 start_codon:yes stop_codon:yes gene_type:complete